MAWAGRSIGQAKGPPPNWGCGGGHSSSGWAWSAFPQFQAGASIQGLFGFPPTSWGDYRGSPHLSSGWGHFGAAQLWGFWGPLWGAPAFSCGTLTYFPSWGRGGRFFTGRGFIGVFPRTLRGDLLFFSPPLGGCTQHPGSEAPFIFFPIFPPPPGGGLVWGFFWPPPLVCFFSPPLLGGGYPFFAPKRAGV